jgi:hypothetical protein
VRISSALRAVLAAILVAAIVLPGVFASRPQTPLSTRKRISNVLHAGNGRILLVTTLDSGSEIFHVSFGGCAATVELFAASTTLEDQPYFERVLSPGGVRSYVYMGDTWTTLDHNELWGAYFKVLVRNVFRREALVNIDRMIETASPTPCKAVAALDWGPVWDPAPVAAPGPK